MSDILSQDQIEEMLRNAGHIDEPAQEEPSAEAAVEAPAAASSSGDPEIMSLAPADRVEKFLTRDEQDILGEMGNICMGTAATTMFSLLTRMVNITTPTLSVLTVDELSHQYPFPLVIVEITYTQGVEGINLLILKREDVALITDLMLGGDGKIDPTTVVMDELHLSAIQEVMNQMVGSSSTSLSELVNKTVDISTPRAKELVIGDEPLAHEFSDPNEQILKISFSMEIEGLLTSEIMQVLPIPFAKRLAADILRVMTGGDEPLAPIADVPKAGPDQPAASSGHTPQTDVPVYSSAAPSYTPAPEQQPAAPAYAPPPAPPAYTPPPDQQQPPYGAPPGYPPPQYGQPPYGAPGYPPPQYGQPPYGAPGYPPPQYGQPPYGYDHQPSHNIIKEQAGVDVRAAKFPAFDEMSPETAGLAENINMILDVPMKVTVELGKTRKNIKEILGFNTGSVIVLDKIAGEAVDILVNGKKVGKGEVVVIDDNYGVRITEINMPSADKLL